MHMKQTGSKMFWSKNRLEINRCSVDLIYLVRDNNTFNDAPLLFSISFIIRFERIIIINLIELHENWHKRTIVIVCWVRLFCSRLQSISFSLPLSCHSLDISHSSSSFGNGFHTFQNTMHHVINAVQRPSYCSSEFSMNVSYFHN